MRIKKWDKDILESLEKKGNLHRDDIYAILIKKHNIAKKKQKDFKQNIYINYLSKLVRDKLVVRTGKNIYGVSLESKSPVFVNQFAERISIDKLKTLETLSKKFRTKTGFYFLFQKKKVYYVGIGNVFKRLRDHAYVDKHKGKWDNFSFYITERIEHAKEIETIIQRNIQLDGNIKKGRLKNSKDIKEHIDKYASILADLK